MRKTKKILAVLLAVSCVFSSVAYAETVVVPPISTGLPAVSSGTVTGPDAGVTSGNTSSGPTVSGTTTTGTTTTETTAAATAAASGTSVQKPTVSSQGAVLLNANTGEFLFDKNMDTKFYPASITKVMTALLVVENCSLDDTVTFSKTATTNLESGAVSLNLTEGDKLTVRQCLYALLLKSANEVGNGLAEHVSGSISSFAEKMTAKAAALGCTNTHFTNPHGLNDTNHYTTPHDMALIAREAYKHQEIITVDSSLTYEIPATKLAAARTITMGHKMFYPSDTRYYPGIIGGKTGYTSKAGNTLVTCVEKNGVRLIAVVMKSSGTHYTDTKALLDYGFAVAGNSGSSSSSSQGPVASTTAAAETTGAVSPTETSAAAQETQAAGSWGQDSTGWYYNQADGTKAANRWLTIGEYDYWFDSNGYMATGWRKFSNGDWYYLKSSGAMAKNYWIQDQGKWFYMGSTGAMLKDTTTPDGYKLDASGVWIQ